MKKTNRLITILIFIFLYIPMAVLIVASFNTGKDITHFEGFTLNRYVELFHDEHLLKLLGNSLLVSILASVIATVFGTLSAVGINALNPKLRQTAMTATQETARHSRTLRPTEPPNGQASHTVGTISA